MRFLTKFVLALVLPAFVPAEPFPPLATLNYKAKAASAWQQCPAPRVVDGDTIRCGSERVRLLGIDAPELPGHCARYRRCVAGNPYRSTDSLRQAVRSGPVRYRTIKRDRYGRAVADVHAGNVDLSCWQLQQGAAEYISKWDNGGIIARACSQ
jgi:endonuclease YncB( thermonuclease family)